MYREMLDEIMYSVNNKAGNSFEQYKLPSASYRVEPKLGAFRQRGI